eukprot:scaffold201707_cov36-Prasinocladus_malaysianus.AAC.2
MACLQAPLQIKSIPLLGKTAVAAVQSPRRLPGRPRQARCKQGTWVTNMTTCWPYYVIGWPHVHMGPEQFEVQLNDSLSSNSKTFIDS